MKQTVYIASPESQEIHVWRLNKDEGTLTLLQIINVPGKVQPMTINPNRSFLYAGIRPEYAVLVYRIMPDDGTLKLIDNISLPGSPSNLSTDLKGNFIFISSYNTNCVIVISLKDGYPIKIVDIIKDLKGCHSANIMQDDRTLWVTALEKNCIYLFTVSDSGLLVAHDPSEINTNKDTGPRHLVFHHNQQYAYVVNELNSSVSVWERKVLYGQIECIQTLDIMPPNFSGNRWAADIHITPNSRHLYACDRAANLITIFSISENGSSLELEGYQYTESQPRSFNIDFNGKYLIVAGQKSNHITLYEIMGQKGFLEEKGRYAVGQGPTWVAMNAH